MKRVMTRVQGVVPLHDSFSIHNRSLVLHTAATCSVTHRRGTYNDSASARTHQRWPEVPFATREVVPTGTSARTGSELHAGRA
jgi:hypothetical protein